MTFRTLIRRSLRFHARSHFGVVLGAAIASATLIGALVVGDSVKETLRQRSLQRLAGAWYALAPTDRTFSPRVVIFPSGFTGPLTSPVLLPESPATTLLALPGTASTPVGKARANHVQVFGVDEDFGRFVGALELTHLSNGDIVLNKSLATQLCVQKGEPIILNVLRHSATSLEAAITPRDRQTIKLRLMVTGVLPAESGGDLDLRAGGVPPMNAFVNLSSVAAQTGLDDRANLLLVGPITKPSPVPQQGARLLLFQLRHLLGRFLRSSGSLPVASVDESLHWLQALLQQCWKLDDAGLKLESAPGSMAELRSLQVFLETPTVAAAKAVEGTNCVFILTYLANLLSFGTNSTPYSMVTAAGPPYTPAAMRDDEIILNQWLADDLQAKAGDEVLLSYYAPESGATLIERTNIFRVHSIVPIAAPWGDRTLMPDFPGIEKAESARDWDAGFPLVNKIRPKDEDYWKKYRGTPKAFVTLATGQKMWANRFGALTAIRFKDRGHFVEPLLATLKPEDLGLRFQPVREQALKAAEQSQDFGRLFLGFSLFLVAAALLLMGLLFQFGVEQRTTEIGTLLALGFTARQVRRMLLFEGAALALLGGVLGTLGGLCYAKAMLWGLATVWRKAVGASSLNFHATPLTLLAGFCSAVCIALLTIWLTLRKQARIPPRLLLAGDVQHQSRAMWATECREAFGVRGACSRFWTWAKGRKREQAPRTLPQCGTSRGAWDLSEAERLVSDSKQTAAGDSRRWRWNMAGWIAVVCGLGALGTVSWAVSSGQSANAEAFFSAGTLLLAAGLGLTSAWLGSLARRTNVEGFTLGRLGLRGCARRRTRSLATIALLSSGCFIVAAIGVFRLDANQNATKRSSGTGGFALIGESSLPIVQDLNGRKGREAFGLNEEDLQGAQVVAFRVHEGDEASCLNLNRAQKPRLLGVKPELLAGRFTFAQVAGGRGAATEWQLLSSSRREEALTNDSAPGASPPANDHPDGSGTSAATGQREVPAIGDANSIQWALGKRIGDTLDYTDEHGHPFKVRLVGAIANSILQGSLIIDEAEFVRRFPDEAGYRMFLIDAPSNSLSAVSATLSRAMQDEGLEVTRAAERLNAFNAVQNTYLGTFQVLGGLGVLLGSAGLGVVVLRNVLERRGELGLLAAVGFRRRLLQRLVLSEHGVLLGAGLGLGILAAAVAVLPALLRPGSQLPPVSLALTLGGVLLNGLAWTWLAARWAVRGDLLTVLRNE